MSTIAAILINSHSGGFVVLFFFKKIGYNRFI